MIDVSRIRYDLVAVTPRGQRLHLIGALQGLSWEEQPGELAVRLQAEMANRRTPEGWLHQLLALGGQVLLFSDWGEGWREVFRGIIFAWDYRSGPQGLLSITAYDPLIYLAKSEDDRFYESGTQARAILSDIAGAWNLPMGTVAGPDLILPRQVFRSKTVADMIADVLEQARLRGAGRFILRYRTGVVEVIRPGGNTPVYHLGAEDVVQDAEDHWDIEQLVTRVKIVGAEDGPGRAPVVARLDGRTEFGVLQKVVAMNQCDTPSAVEEAARTVLAERGQPQRQRRLTAPDLPFLRRDDKVHVTAGTLSGYYLVAGVQHDADKRTMTLEVEDVEG